MAKKISELTAAAALVGDEQLPVTQGGSTKRASLGAITPPGYIDGLKMVWVSDTALTVTSGAAYIPGLGRVLRVPSDIAKAGLTLSASTWYHVYLFLNGATPDIEIVTTAPTAPYNGTARAKTGDTSRRYVGSVISKNDGSIFPFLHSANSIVYKTPGTVFRVLSNGGATSTAIVDCSAAVPVTATTIGARFLNLASSDTLFVSPGDAQASVSVFFLQVGSSGATAFQYVPIYNQTLAYSHSVATSGAFIDAYGYTYER